MDLDAQRFRRTAAYLEKLPDGILSYPECQLKSDIHEEVGREFPQLLQGGGLPVILKQYLTGQHTEKWFPEAAGNALMLSIRDVCFSTDAAFLKWSCDYIGRLFQRPLYRILMNVFSTSLVVMGASKRWSTFHRGTQLKPEPLKKRDGRCYVTGEFSYPPHLYNDLIMDHMGSVYKAALLANRAEDIEIVVDSVGETKSRMSISWKI